VRDFRWRRLAPDEVRGLSRVPVDPATLEMAGEIVRDVGEKGEAAVRRYAERFGELEPGQPWIVEADELRRVLVELEGSQRALLERAAERIERFAVAQRDSVRDFSLPVSGGFVGQQLAPVERAGCYAPGGRYPLPSSVLMTAVTARVAGVGEVWVASPRPQPMQLAAAAVAGADGLLAVGGAQAIAALALGSGPFEPCDVVVGPGNRWVTAAKQLVAGRVGIDMLAGPSELVVLADASADPALIAADLLAQAEHDPEALPVLVSLEPRLIDQVESALRRQLEGLATAETALDALERGFAVAAGSLAEAVTLCDRLAPEHLQVVTERPDRDARHLHHYGALFLGASSAEVFADYGIGPNHTLPTGGGARYRGGLSVLDFLRVRTWMKLDSEALEPSVIQDSCEFARFEGLEAHARSAEVRRSGSREER